MAVHLYGVLDAGALPAPATRGLDGCPVRTLMVGARCVWVSDVAESTLVATAQRILTHDAVLRGAIDRGNSVVPSLFGSLHANDAALIGALQANAAAIESAMTLARGRVEMSVVVAPSENAAGAEAGQPSQSSGPGHAHLQGIRDRLHAERNLRGSAAELGLAAARALAGLYLAERVVDDPEPPVLFARAHLVARDHVARYLRAVKSEAVRAHPALRIAVRGPGAAYSFAAIRIG